MLTRFAIQKRKEQNQCLGSRHCEFFQVVNGMCSSCGGRIMILEEVRDNLFVEAKERYHVQEATENVCAAFETDFRHLNSLPMSFKLKVVAFISLHQERYKGILFPPAVIDRILLLRHLVPFENDAQPIVFDGVCLSFCFKPMHCKSADNVAMCYYGNMGAAPSSVQSWGKLFQQHQYVYNMQTPYGGSLFSSHGEV